MKRQFSRLACVVAMAALGTAPVTASAADVVIKFATESSGDHINIALAEAMKKSVEGALPGKVEFQIFPGAQLGNQTAVIAGLQQGTHMMSVQASPMASLVPAFGVFEAPFLFGTRAEVMKVVDGPLGERLKKEAAAKGIEVLAIGELGFRQISNNVRPIVKPEDLDGVKLRTPGNPFRLKMFQTFGANPTPMSFSEVYVALRQGVIDGQENPLGSIWGAKFHEVQKFVSMSNHVFTPNAVVVSKLHWDSWPADVQKAVQAAADEAAELSFRLGEQRDTTLLDRMKEANPELKVNEIDSKAFRAKAAPLYDEVKKNSGEDVWKMVQDSMGM
ncbi:MAG: TRAP transporter substrate-binding protein [Acetobacterales bacterium]